MLVSDWIRAARAIGWKAKRGKDGLLYLSCARQGCKGRLTLPLTNLGPEPTPCPFDHHGQYGCEAYELYITLVDQLIARRKALGLSQEDLNAAAGLADGHMNKLESFARTAQFPTIKLWAQTLGLSIVVTPRPLPAVIINTLESRSP